SPAATGVPNAANITPNRGPRTQSAFMESSIWPSSLADHRADRFRRKRFATNVQTGAGALHQKGKRLIPEQRANFHDRLTMQVRIRIFKLVRSASRSQRPTRASAHE